MKEEFKEFVKNNPSLIKYIRSNEMTWQKFYEMYNLYGKDSEVWNEYLGKSSSTHSMNEVVNWFKNIDLDNLKEGIGNLERVLSVVKDFTKKDDTVTSTTYKPRPLYKHFED